MVATTTTVQDVPVRTSPRISWGAVIAGTLVSIGIWVLLYAVGLALGLSSVDRGDVGSLRAAGIGTGIWGLIAPLIALFIGGVVAARESGVAKRSDGAIHGMVLWSLTTVLGMVLVGSVISSVAGGAARTMGKLAGVTAVAGGAAGSAAGAKDQPGDNAVMGLNVDDALTPINQRLEAEGKPAITAAQLQAALKDAANTAVTTGNFDRAALTSAIAANTNLSQADANEIAMRAERSWNEKKSELKTQATAAADTTGKAMWGVAGALFLGLLAAMLGAALGVDRYWRRRRTTVIADTPPTTTYVPSRA
jgi:hypothetical protein